MNIINALPGILPTARPYTMGKWPQKRIKMRNGRTVRWGLSSRQGEDKMELLWENITYAQAEQLSAVWDASYGILGELTLPPEAFAGASTSLASLLAIPFPGAVWAFAGPPQVNAEKARRCTVRIPIKTRFTPFSSFAFSEVYGWGPAAVGKALVAPEIPRGVCPAGCGLELGLERDNQVLYTNSSSVLHYVIGPNDFANGKLKVRWKYRCKCQGQQPGPWKDASLGKTIAIQDPLLQPTSERQYEFLWTINVLRFGFVNPIGGWKPANTLIRVETVGDPFIYIPPEGPPGIPAIKGNVYETNTGTGATEQIVLGGTFFAGTPWVYVEKTRYSINGGPYIDGDNFSKLL